jgi:hypothetical protein
LLLTPSIPGLDLYIDGPNITVPLAPGMSAEFTASSEPLLLLR